MKKKRKRTINEHYLMHKMRGHPDFIKEMSFVAEYESKIVGNIAYSKAWLIDEDGQEFEIVSFGPLSVLPQFQRKGIGSALITYSIKIAINSGSIKAIVILGDPHNYCKVFFKIIF